MVFRVPLCSVWLALTGGAVWTHKLRLTEHTLYLRCFQSTRLRDSDGDTHFVSAVSALDLETLKPGEANSLVQSHCSTMA